MELVDTRNTGRLCSPLGLCSISHWTKAEKAESGCVSFFSLFHDDHHASFGVNDEGNYWHCFAGCGGGSVIDFWMKWRKCDFTTVVRELAKVLL